MLSTMRRHQTWALKLILAVIIISFIFFFGFNQIREASQGFALKINGDTISSNEYQLFYDQQYEQYKKMFQGQEMPDFLSKSIRASTQRLLAQRKLLTRFGESLGFTVTDQELANWIVQHYKEGTEDFDPIAYKNFLSQFQSRNRLSYEDLLKEDLLVQKIQDWLAKGDQVSPLLTQSLQDQQKSKWTFEVLDAKTKKVAQKVGPISIGEYPQLFRSPLPLEQYVPIFQLTSAKPLLGKPIEQDGKSYLVRLVKKETKEETKAPEKLSLGQQWVAALLEKAKIKSNLPSEE